MIMIQDNREMVFGLEYEFVEAESFNYLGTEISRAPESSYKIAGRLMQGNIYMFELNKLLTRKYWFSKQPKTYMYIRLVT